MMISITAPFLLFPTRHLSCRPLIGDVDFVNAYLLVIEKMLTGSHFSSYYYVLMSARTARRPARPSGLLRK